MKRPRRGAILKEEVRHDRDWQVVKYSLAYINPAVFGADNGRVLGYTVRRSAPVENLRF